MKIEITNLDLDIIYQGRPDHHKRKTRGKISSLLHFKLIWTNKAKEHDYKRRKKHHDNQRQQAGKMVQNRAYYFDF